MKFIDISQTIDNNTPVYPGDYKISLTESKTMQKDKYTAYLLQSGLHTGTHIDMPMHLIGDKKTAAEMEITRFIGKGVLLDARGESLIKYKRRYEDAVTADCIVLINTGFDKYYNEPRYFNEYPVLSCELTDWLISKNVKMVGIDTPSPDRSPFPVHKSLLLNGIFILENLTNLQSLYGAGNFEVIALPLKIAAEASFTRAVCKIY